MRPTKAFIVLAAVLLFASVVLTACSSEPETPATPDGGDVAVTGEQAEETAQQAIDDQLVEEDSTVDLGELV